MDSNGNGGSESGLADALQQLSLLAQQMNTSEGGGDGDGGGDLAQILQQPQQSAAAAATAATASAMYEARGRLASVSPAPLPDKEKRSGWAEKQGGLIKNWKRRYFIMTESLLRYLEQPSSPRPKGVINLRAVTSVLPVSLPHATIGLEIRTPSRSYLLRYSTLAERDSWTASLEARVAALKNEDRQRRAAQAALAIAQRPGAPDDEAAPRPPTVLLHTAASAMEAKAGLDSLIPPSRKRSHFLPRITVDSDALVIELLKQLSDPSGPQIIVVRGTDGSGRSTALRRLCDALEENYAPYFSRETPGVRRIALLACDSCHEATATDPAAPLELICEPVAVDEGKTRSGKGRLRGGQHCPACKSGKQKLHWLTITDDELLQLQQTYKANHATAIQGCALCCAHCQVTGVPMVQTGLCTLVDGELFSVEGARMPQIQTDEWKLSLPHLALDCRGRRLDVLPLAFTAQLVDSLANLRETAGMGRVALPHPIHFLTEMHGAYMNSLPLGCMQRLCVRSEDRIKERETAEQLPCSKGELRLYFSNIVRKQQMALQRPLLYMFTHLEASPYADAPLDLLPEPYPKGARIIMTATPAQARCIMESAASKGLSTLTLDMATFPWSPAARRIAADGFLQEFAEALEVTLNQSQVQQAAAELNRAMPRDASPLYLRLVVGAYVLQLDSQGKIEEVAASAMTENMPVNEVGVVDLLVSVLETQYPTAAPRLLPALAHLPGPVFPKFMQLITEEEQQRDKGLPTMAQGDVDAFLSRLRGTFLIMKNVSYINFQGPVERRLLRQHYERRQQNASSLSPSQARSDAAWADVLADAVLANTREDPYNTPVVGYLPRLLDMAGRHHDLILQLKQWDYIHLAMKGTMYAAIKDGFARALRWLHNQVDAADGTSVEEEIRGLETRESFIMSNKKALAEAESYRPAVSRFTALQNVKEIKPVLLGFNDEGLRMPSHVVRIFTSSTFDDLRHERDALMARAYPEIRRRLRQFGLEFQVVDMRWGIRDESTNDHQTAAICMKEIEECQRESLGPNFVTFLSQRYGYRPFPCEILKEEFELLRKFSPKSGASYLDKWFLLNANMVPPVYVLQPVTTHLPDFLNNDNAEKRRKARSKWWTAFEAMADALREAAVGAFPDREERRRPYSCSVTETEIRNGVMALDNENRRVNCVWFKRNIVDLEDAIAKKDGEVAKYTDLDNDKGQVDGEAMELLSILRERDLPSVMPSDRIHEFDVKFASGRGIDPENPEHAAYIDQLVNKFVNTMEDMVRENLMRQNASLMADELYQEVVSHNILAGKQARVYRGREHVCRRITEYFQRADERLPLIYMGAMGQGKSFVAAKAWSLAQTAFAATPCVAVRFVAQTALSDTSEELMHTLAQQLAVAFDQDYVVPTDRGMLTRLFESMLKLARPDRPIILILDGLERLAPSDPGRNCLWLPLRLPPHVKVIVTLNPAAHDVTAAIMKRIFGQTCFENFVFELPTMSEEDAHVILDGLVTDAGRSLTPVQRNAIVKSVLKDSAPSPLALRVACDLAQPWTDKTKGKAIELPSSPWELFNLYLDRLERIHGRALVSRALSYVAIAQEGVTSTELEDLLSLDDDVLNDVFQYWTPPVRRIPPLLWVRLQRDLGNYLLQCGSVAQVPVLNFGQQELKDVVLARYLGHTADVPSTHGQPKPNLEALKADQEARVAFMNMTCTPVEPQVTDAQQQLHRMCAAYFAGDWHNKAKPYTDRNNKLAEADRLVPSQPPLLAPSFNQVTMSYNKVNARRAIELLHHLAQAGDRERLREVLEEPATLSFYHATRKSSSLTSSSFGRRYASYCDVAMSGDAGAGVVALIEGMLPQLEQQGAQFDGLDAASQDALLATLNSLATQGFMSRIGHRTARVSALLEQCAIKKVGEGRFMNRVSYEQKAAALLAAGDAEGAIAVSNTHVDMTRVDAGTDSVQYALALQKRGRLFFTLGRWQQAVDDLQLSANITAKLDLSGMDNNEIHVSNMSNLAELYFKLGLVQQAAQLMNDALSRSIATRGEEHEDTATLMNNMAAIMLQTGNYGPAESYFAKAINVRQAVLGARHSLVGSAMGNLAGLYLQISVATGQSRYAEALPLLERAEEIAQLSQDEEAEDDRLTVMNNMAHCLRGLGRKEEALAAMHKVVELAANLKMGDVKDRVASCKHNLAVFYMDEHDWRTAEQLLLEAYEIRNSHLGEQHLKTSETAECIAICFQQTGRMQESIVWYNRAKMGAEAATARDTPLG